MSTAAGPIEQGATVAPGAGILDGGSTPVVSGRVLLWGRRAGAYHGRRMGPETAETLTGILESVVHADPDTGFAVVRLCTSDGGRLTAVGTLGEVFGGEELTLTGRWVDDARWGRQFRVREFSRRPPATAEGVERYLSSGLVKDIGPKLARRIVERFGARALDVIESEPARLAEVRGLGPKRLATLLSSFAQQKGLRDLCVALGAHGVGTSVARRIWLKHGPRSLAVVQGSPYSLVRDVPGIGFRTADGIARRLGLAEDSPERTQAACLHAVEEAASGGHMYLPVSSVAAHVDRLTGAHDRPVVAALERLAEVGAVVLDPAEGEQRVYRPSLHRAERGAARRLAELLAAGARMRGAAIEERLGPLERQWGLTFHPLQRDALARLSSTNILLVTGGPGTGKTTLVRAILAILGGGSLSVALAAPTGRAAKRLEEATGTPAQTLHRLLGFNPRSHEFTANDRRPLDIDGVVVDEVSMVDTVLLNALVRALRPGTVLVLVGDADQLPSVGPGSVLKDLVRSATVPVARLSHIFRQDERGWIVSNAHRINRGEVPRWPQGSAGTSADFYFFERDEPVALARTVIDLAAARIPRSFGLDPRRDVQVLVPMYRGEAGIDALNGALRDRLNPSGPPLGFGPPSLRVGDKVLQLSNDYERDVTNGDIGYIVSADARARTAVVDIEGRSVVYGAADLEHVTLAYAVSVHKAQGSEYPAVVIPLSTQHYLLLQRNLLYTAVTRGRRLVVLVGSRRAMQIAVSNDAVEQRYSALAERLAAEVRDMEARRAC